jgi:hypothetical protein
MGEKIMKKLSLLLIALLLAGCSSRTNLNGDAKFNSMLLKSFVLQDDLVVFKHQGSKGTYKVIGFDFQGIPSRKEIKNKFPYRHESNLIYGVLAKGAQFKITNIYLFRNVETSQIRYEAQVLSDGLFKGKTIEVSLLTDGSEVPKFLDKYAVEVKQ